VLTKYVERLPTLTSTWAWHQSILGKVHAPDLIWLYCRWIDPYASPDHARSLSPLCCMTALPIDAVHRARGVVIALLSLLTIHEALTPLGMLRHNVTDDRPDGFILDRLSWPIRQHRTRYTKQGRCPALSKSSIHGVHDCLD